MSLVQKIEDINRFEKIVRVLFKYELGHIIYRMKLHGFLTLKQRLEKGKIKDKMPEPEMVRKAMEELGGGFIKLGQLLSLRPDLIPEEYCQEFRKFQDCVEPFDTETAIKIIERELKKPLHSVFEKFEKKPIASASIGQVYKAKLRNGGEVAIKVKRPGVEKVFKTDIDLLYVLAEMAEKHFKPEMLNPIEIVKEFEEYTKSEMDYRVEARNIMRIHQNFTQEKRIVIPKVYLEHSTSDVLTIEFIEGKNISEIKAWSERRKKKIVSLVVNSIFKQVFEDGFFHADPHPGNILIMENDRIAFLDFGIIGYIDEQLKEYMGDLFISAINRDVEGMADAIINLGMAPIDVEMEDLKNEMHMHLSKYHGIELKDIDLSRLFSDLINISRKSKIKLPSSFVLLVKAIITVEGFALELNPKFELVDEAKPFIKKMSKNRMSPENIIGKMKKVSFKFTRLFLHMPDKADEMLRRVKDADMTARKIDEDIKSMTAEMDHSSNRLSLGLLIAAFIIAGASLATLEQRKIFELPMYSFFSFLIAAMLGIFLIYSTIKEKF